jgi:hypothetical protein
VALVTVFVVSCSGSPAVHGRYYQRINWIEFRNDGRVLHGELGDVVRFRIDQQDAQKLILFDANGQAVGRIVGPATVEFPQGDGPLASAFAGRWVSRASSDKSQLSEVAARDAAGVLIGEWRIAGATDVLVFRQDGSYEWGPRIRGTYTMLGASRVRMTLVEDGKPVGRLDNEFVVSGTELRLTAPDGAVTTYQRVN